MNCCFDIWHQFRCSCVSKSTNWIFFQSFDLQSKLEIRVMDKLLKILRSKCVHQSKFGLKIECTYWQKPKSISSLHVQRKMRSEFAPTNAKLKRFQSVLIKSFDLAPAYHVENRWVDSKGSYCGTGAQNTYGDCFKWSEIHKWRLRCTNMGLLFLHLVFIHVTEIEERRRKTR